MNSATACFLPTIEQVPIGAIATGGNHRPLRDVHSLAESIQRIGLLQPIVVVRDQDHFRLIAGRHRLEACRALGWTEIPASVATLDDLTAELAAIDENLIRAELTALERAEQLARRKALYEVLYPETKTVSGKALADKRWHASDKMSPASFTEDTAAITGTSRKTVERAIAIATRLSGPVRDQLRPLPVADCESDLRRLARLDEPAQAAVIARLTAGTATTVREAEQHLRRQAAAEALRQTPTCPMLRACTYAELLATLEDGSVDLVLTDPPFRDAFTDDATFVAFVVAWVEAALAKVKPTGRAYIFSGATGRELAVYHGALEAACGRLGLRLDEHPGFWVYKNTIGPKPTHTYKGNCQVLAGL